MLPGILMSAVTMQLVRASQTLDIKLPMFSLQIVQSSSIEQGLSSDDDGLYAGLGSQLARMLG